MNTKAVLGLVAIAILAIGYLFLGPGAPPSPSATSSATSSATTLPAPTSTAPQAGRPGAAPASRSQPTFDIGSTTKAVVRAFALFDSTPITSISEYPVITGSANVAKVGMIVYDSKGAGITGTAEIPVEGGRWSYAISVALPPGTYKLVLMGGDTNQTAALTVKKPS